MIILGALAALLGLRSVTGPRPPERELPPTAAEWSDPDRDPIEYDLGAAGSVALPAGWTPGHALFRGPGGGGSYMLFQHRGSGTVLHLNDGTGTVLPFDLQRIADTDVRAQAEEIMRDLSDGE